MKVLITGGAGFIGTHLAKRLRSEGHRVTVYDRKYPEFDLKPAHDLIIGAWRFAESAVDTRYSAVRSGDVSVAWQASSSAAGALLFIDKAQRELRSLLQPPQLQ